MREMPVHRRFGEALRFRIGIGDENMPLHPDRDTAGKLSLRLRRSAAFPKRRLERVDIGLCHLRRAERDEMKAVLAGPGRADVVRRAVPERRMRLLQRPQRDRHILIDEMIALITERIRDQAGAEALEGVDEYLARLIVLDLVEFQ